MSKVRVKVLPKGTRALLRDPKVFELKRRADQIAAAAGPGHDVEISVGRNRAHADIATDTFEARAAEARNRSLTRAIDAGRR